MSSKNRITVVECLECGAEIVLKKRPNIGQKVTCPECDMRFQIVSLDPIDIDWLYGYSDESDEDFDNF